MSTAKIDKIDYVENPYYNKKYMELSTARVIVLNPTTKQQLFLCELESDELTQKVDEEKIKSDIYNHTIAVINKNKEITFKATEVVSRMDLQLAKFGASMERGVVFAWTDPNELFRVQKESSTGKLYIQLKHKQAIDGELNVLDPKTSKRIPLTKYSVSDDGYKVVFNEDDPLVELDKNLMVTAYQYKTEADYATINEEPLPSVVSLIVLKPLYDTNDKIVAYKQYIFPKASGVSYYENEYEV